MRLFEFDPSRSLNMKIVAITDQLKNDLNSGKITPDMTLDQLITYYQKYGIHLSPDNLYTMIKTDPMKDVIKNIQGNKIIFKGLEPDGRQLPDENQKIVQQMAKKTLGK
jgi:hypothetical protein